MLRPPSNILRFLRSLSAVCSLLFISLLLNAQPHPLFHHYTTEQGLPSSEIYKVIQDSKGYIWFATDNGVSRYNGYEFESFSIKDGLNENTVFEVCEDPKGRIWFLSLSCMLNYYENGKIKQFKYNDKLKKELKNPLKTSFTIDSTNAIHLGSLGAGHLIIDTNGVVKNLNPLMENSIFHVRLDETQPGTMIRVTQWIASQGPVQLDITTKAFSRSLIIPEYDITPASSPSIQLRDKRVLYSHNNRIYIISAHGDPKVLSFNSRIISLKQDSEKNIWVGIYKEGVYCYKGGDLDAKPLKLLPGLSVTSVCRTSEGGFWFSTIEEGAYSTPSLNFLTYDESTGLSHKRVNAIATDGRTVYAGMQSGILHMITGDTIRSINMKLEKKQEYIISHLFYDTVSARLWISNTGGGAYLEKGKLFPVDSFYTVHCINRSPDGIIWIGNHAELRNYTNGAMRVVFLYKRILAIEPEGNDKLWLGTSGGLWIYNRREKKQERAYSNYKLLDKHITSLKKGANNTLMVGTKGYGLLILHNDSLYHISMDNGLSNDNVTKLFIEGNTVWAATSNGLNRITIRSYSPFAYTIRTYGIADGLVSNEVTDVLRAGDKMWVATLGGLTVFDDSKVPEISPSIPVYITSVIAGNKELDGKPGIPYNQPIQVSFIGLSSHSNGKIMYRYMLKGLSSEWITTTNREVQFAALPAGDYTFIVSAQNEHSAWSAPAMISFTVIPPYWETWWFRISAMVMVIVIVVVIFIIRERRIQKREKEKNRINREMLELQMKALRAQMNPHFAFNVMNSIQRFILENDSDSAHRYLTRFARLLRLVLNHSESPTIPLSEELKALTLYLELEAMRFSDKFTYSILVDPQVETEIVMIPSMLMQPYVENAILHGLVNKPGKGKISIEVRMEGEMLVCTIEDDGIGREAAAKLKTPDSHRSMGTVITDERIRLLNTSVGKKIRSRVTDLTGEDGSPAGTRVEILIPLIYSKVNEDSDN